EPGRHSAAGAAARTAGGPTGRLAGGRRGALAALLGVAGGAIIFLPWFSQFLYQSAHTGTPWGEPASYAAVSHAYGQWAGGPTTLGRLLLLVITCLVALGIAGRGLGGRFVLIDLRGGEPGRTLFLLSTVTLVVAVTVGKVVGNAWADRYTATAFVPFLLVVGLGATIVRHERFTQGVVALCAAAGVIAGYNDVQMPRTQATEAAEILAAKAKPGDVLLICPDQVGPGLARTIPSFLLPTTHLVPDYRPPDRVNWVDYEERNEAADGVAIADRALAEAGKDHSVFLATSGGYRTYETLCLQIQTHLGQQRPQGSQEMEQGSPTDVYENYLLARFPPS
ncbi:hypothetical protein I6A84_00230, partial [Frankia sp. CNm7]|nr:hypothetical protein [Frankia nepalensis]